MTDNRRESVRDVLRQITTVFVPGLRLAEAGHTAQREPVGVVGGGRQGRKVFLCEREFSMTRSQLIAHVAAATGMTEAVVENVMDSVFDTIVEKLQQGEKVTIAGFGRFEMRERKTKSFTNPKTKVASQLAPTTIPGFKASGRLKERLSK